MSACEDAPWLDVRASSTGRLTQGGKLHATVYVAGSGAPGIEVLACDARKVVPVDLRLDYRMHEFGACRKKGCAAYFELARAGQLG